MNDLREYLKKLREEKGMTQQKVAESIGFSQHYYSLIENGERQQKMDVQILNKLAIVFDTSIIKLLELELKNIGKVV